MSDNNVEVFSGQPCADSSRFGDGSNSVTSFEDVGHSEATAKDMVVLDPRPTEKGQDKPATLKVPDIRYVLQYKGINGSIIESRESDKPLHHVEEASQDQTARHTLAAPKPVLEIITTVETIKKHRDAVELDGCASSLDSASLVSDSDEDSAGEDGKGFSYTKKVGRDHMVVYSKHLIAAFNAVIGSYPGTNFLGDTVTIKAPYYPLIHYRSALSRHRTAQPACHGDEYAATTAKHIDVLLGYLDRTYGSLLREEEARYKRSPPVATFEWLWLVFRPGEVVYRKIHDVWTAFVVNNVTSKHRADNGRVKKYEIDCWNIRYRLGRMQRASCMFGIAPFPGEQTLQNLAVVPAAFFPEDMARQGGLTMAQKQIEMGRMYWELVKRPSYKEFDGQLIDRDDRRAGHLNGRVIVDAEGYDRFARQATDRHMGPNAFPHPPLPTPIGRPLSVLPQFAPRCTCDACVRQDPDRTGTPSPFANFEERNPLQHEPPRNELYFLVCAPDIPALILTDRRWGHVGVDRLTDVRCDTEAFKHLVLDPGVKLTVKALIGKFAAADGRVSPWPNDFVRNKGEGRIFLLHGSPGVGKTCTAECVAEMTRRPLLSITSGDLGTPNEERNLAYFLTLGERYGALVLLDEADVYLERRRPRDLRRNALVSVFLRALEYYRGVLFLTTNRVESFDPAFTSRIHVALHYRRLSDEDRERIWANNFDRLERDSAGQVFVSGSARDYVLARGGGEAAELRWNGREIRNALQTAVALAETEAVEQGLERVLIADKHLRQVVKMSRGFKEFLLRRKGYDEDEEEEEDGEESEVDRQIVKKRSPGMNMGDLL